MRTTSFQTFRFSSIYMLTIPLAFMIPPLISTSGYQGWIAMLIGGAVNVVLISCTYFVGKLASNSGQSWVVYGEQIAGKWGHRAVLLLLSFWSIYYVSLDMEQFTLFYGSIYMKDTPPWFILLLVGLVIMITARWGFSTLIYIADGTFILILIGVLFLLLLFIGDADYQMLPALLNHRNFTNLFTDVLSVISWIGEWFIFLFLLPHLNFDKKTLRNLLLANTMVTVAVLLTWLLVLLNFGVHYGSQVKYPILQLIRGTSFTGLLGNADPLFIGIWAISMIIHDAFLVYVGVSCLGHLFKLKETRPLISILTGTATVAAFQYSQNTTQYQKDLSELGFISFWVIINSIPLYYLLLALVRGKFRRKKST
ncbi:GerAB/ArcD/ProY family transporter [Paenibacillus sp. Marseille-P2973]|uniref:GerAB/ArcD/ProY family transporter n=1 Tax=Paenibacillus sp. Marseille-P2973 TaxID=1871032 RepID=UPI001B37ADA3|nr:GerAB/ArcD/ProY family transporter [Paenibacillus sp. Marseille-P2973]MBQ4897944.1 GerAB/ArcD/ProY family transporter [Paenibacillus sp. Marseille-P2973]